MAEWGDWEGSDFGLRYFIFRTGWGRIKRRFNGFPPAHGARVEKRWAQAIVNKRGSWLFLRRTPTRRGGGGRVQPASQPASQSRWDYTQSASQQLREPAPAAFFQSPDLPPPLQSSVPGPDHHQPVPSRGSLRKALAGVSLRAAGRQPMPLRAHGLRAQGFPHVPKAPQPQGSVGSGVRVVGI